MAKIKAVCQGCGSRAHGELYDMRQTGDKPGERTGKKFLCILCARSLVGNAVDYPEQYDRPVTVREALAHMNNVTNLLLDKIEKLSKEIKR